jgi:hypothetical protein
VEHGPSQNGTKRPAVAAQVGGPKITAEEGYATHVSFYIYMTVRRKTATMPESVTKMEPVRRPAVSFESRSRSDVRPDLALMSD